MKPVRRELLNGLFVLVLASLISVAFEAFHVNFNVQLWVLILDRHRYRGQRLCHV